VIVGGSDIGHGVIFSVGGITDLYGHGITSIFGISAINDWGQMVGSYKTDDGLHSRALLLNPVNPNTSTVDGVTNTKFVAGMSYDKFTAVTNSAGQETTVALVGGTVGSGGDGPFGKNRNVNVSFSNSVSAPIASDIVNLSGNSGATFADPLVLQLTYDEATAIALFGSESKARLGWFEPGSQSWKLAVDGNTGTPGSLAGFYAMSYANFLNSAGGAFNSITMLGVQGLDTASNTLWAVTNLSGEFSAIENTRTDPQPPPLPDPVPPTGNDPTPPGFSIPPDSGTAAVPETSTWVMGAMVTVGFFLIVRRKKKVAAIYPD
jgi:hypothetical protein